MELKELIPVLQVAIGPVILISGVGLLIGSMNNRLGRTIDRSRNLVEARRNAHDEQQRARHSQQLAILWRRAKLLRAAITFSTVCVLLVAVLIIVLFLSAVMQLEVAYFLIGLFVTCLASLIASLVYFICDVDLSLHALGLEMESPKSDD
jgi:hypothetical protein